MLQQRSETDRGGAPGEVGGDGDHCGEYEQGAKEPQDRRKEFREGKEEGFQKSLDDTFLTWFRSGSFGPVLFG